MESLMAIVLQGSIPQFANNFKQEDFKAICEKIVRNSSVQRGSGNFQDTLGIGRAIASNLPQALTAIGAPPVNIWMAQVAQEPSASQWTIYEGHGEFTFEMASDAKWLFILVHGPITVSSCILTLTQHPFTGHPYVMPEDVPLTAKIIVPSVTLHEQHIPVQLQVARKLGLLIFAEVELCSPNFADRHQPILDALHTIMPPEGMNADAMACWQKLHAAKHISQALPAFCRASTGNKFGCISIRDIAENDAIIFSLGAIKEECNGEPFPPYILIVELTDRITIHFAISVANYSVPSAEHKARYAVQWECLQETASTGIDEAMGTPLPPKEKILPTSRTQPKTPARKKRDKGPASHVAAGTRSIEYHFSKPKSDKSSKTVSSTATQPVG
jgi:hypothetical protein